MGNETPVNILLIAYSIVDNDSKIDNNMIEKSNYRKKKNWSKMARFKNLI